MLNLSNYPLSIGIAEKEADEWFHPILDRGRGGAFIDTGFLRGLLFDNDPYAITAKNYFASASGNFYTTNLVLAETVRQISKAKGTDVPTKTMMFGRCTQLLIDSTTIYVCAPPRNLVLSAYRELKEIRQSIPTLDLCDLLSIKVLEHAQHRRVFGFDTHFTVYGAQLEPNG